MIALITLLIILLMSILVTKVATVALVHTGLSLEVARFQARSAFTGVGFTTSESEKVVNHPVRRRMLMLLMLFGNAGIVAAVASIVLTFINVEGTGSTLIRIASLLAGLILLWVMSVNRWVGLSLSKFIGWMIRHFTDLDVRDYASLLHVAGEYKVTELFIEPNDWLANQELQDLRLQDEGVMIMGITRSDGTYIGGPMGSTKVHQGDTLILYGRQPALIELDQRRKGTSGDDEHKKAVAEQQNLMDKEKQLDATEVD